jgi:hypothetical protein
MGNKRHPTGNSVRNDQLFQLGSDCPKRFADRVAAHEKLAC